MDVLQDPSRMTIQASDDGLDVVLQDLRQFAEPIPGLLQ